MSENAKPRRRFRRFVFGVFAVIVLAAPVVWYFGGVRRPLFDPQAMASAETRMWQAYYTDDYTRLGVELVRFIGAQHRLTLFETARISEMLATSALVFRNAGGDYEILALPMISEAYDFLRRATGAAFDPEEAARAELAWWVARRTPGQDSVEQVGAKIAELYVILYGEDRPGFREAAELRAQAAWLRDRQGARADWATIEYVLVESYNHLQRAIETDRPL